MQEFEQYLVRVIHKAYPKFYVKVNKDGNLYDVDVVGPFGNVEYQDRITGIYDFLNRELSENEKKCIGLINAYTNEEYASECEHEEQEATPLTRWIDRPEVSGFIMCGVFDDVLSKKCQSSFVCFSKDRNTGLVYPTCENYVYEGLAYDFIIRDGNEISQYALNHVYNLAPSFFFSPYMDLYMKQNDFTRYNPYGFAFRTPTFSFAEPSIERMKTFLDVASLTQLTIHTSIGTIKQELEKIIKKIY